MQTTATTENMQTLLNKEIAEKTHTCEICGKEIPPGVVDALWIKTGKMVFTRLCQCELDEEERIRERIKADEIKQKAERLFRNSMMNIRFKDSNFDNWINRNNTENMLIAATNYLQNWQSKKEKGEGILYFGRPGNGKSHITAAITNELLNRGILVIFANVPDLLSQIRATFDGEGSQESIMSNLQRCDLLILDDAGSEKWSEWVEQTLYTIINGRYNNKKPIIITTNLDIPAFEKQIGMRAFDRIIETCQLVECKADSYRKEIARARK